MQKLSMVEYGEAVSRRVRVCFGAVTEDYVARGSTGEPLFEMVFLIAYFGSCTGYALTMLPAKAGGILLALYLYHITIHS